MAMYGRAISGEQKKISKLLNACAVEKMAPRVREIREYQRIRTVGARGGKEEKRERETGKSSRILPYAYLQTRALSRLGSSRKTIICIATPSR